MARKFLSQLTLNLAGNFTKNIKKTDAIARKSFRNISRGFDKMKSRMARGQRNVSRGFMTMLKGAAITAPILAMTKMASNFEKGLAEVGTLTDMTTKQITDNFSDIVQNAQITFGQKSQAVIKSFYDSVSAGSVDMSKGVGVARKQLKEFLTITGRLAVVGVSDMAATTDLMTTVMNAFGRSAADSGELLFKMVRKGKTTIPELSQSLAQVASTAAGMGVTLEETSAIIATLTAQTGQKTPEAMTALKAAITTLAKPSAEAKTIMAELGFVTDTTIVKNLGLVGTLDVLTKKIRAKTSTDDQARKVLANLIPNVRALGPILALSGAQSKIVGENMKFMGAKTDIVNEKFKEMSNTADYKFNQAMQRSNVIMTNFGKALLPLATDIIEALTPMLKDFSKWIKENQQLANTIGKVVLAVGGGVTVIGGMGAAFGLVSIALAPLLIAGGLPFLIGLVLTLGALLPGLSKTLREWGGNWEFVAGIIDGVVDTFKSLIDVITTIASGKSFATLSNIFSRIWSDEMPTVQGGSGNAYKSDSLKSGNVSNSTSNNNNNSVNIDKLIVQGGVNSAGMKENIKKVMQDAQRLALANVYR